MKRNLVIALVGRLVLLILTLVAAAQMENSVYAQPNGSDLRRAMTDLQRGISGVSSQISTLKTVDFQCPASSAIRNDIHFSLTQSDSKIVLHQPVIFTFLARNEGNETIKLNLGADFKENFSFQLIDPSLKRKQLPRLTPEGVAAIGEVFIRPNQTYSQQLLLNEWTAIEVPGSYILEGKISERITAGNGRNIQSPTSFIIKFNVDPYDKEHLKGFCRRLFNSFEKAESYSTAAEAALALTYVGDEMAIPFVTKALVSNRLTEAVIINSLRVRGGRQPIEILIIAAQEKPESEMASYAISSLRWIEFHTPDVKLKQRIRETKLVKEYLSPTSN